MEKKMLVEGMKCMHCKANVEKALKNVPGVTEASVDLEAKTATILMEVNVDDRLLTEAVSAKGFTPVKIL